MAKCKECYHYLVCKFWDNDDKECSQFKAASSCVEVVHAEWQDGYAVRGGKKVYDSIDCSNCNEIFKIESQDREYWKNRFKVCPFCGAVMDGGNEDA